MRTEDPLLAEGVPQSPGSITIELICQRIDHLGTRCYCPVPPLTDVGYGERGDGDELLPKTSVPEQFSRTYSGCMSESTVGPHESSEHSAGEPAAPRGSLFAKHPFLVYTTLRIVVLVVVAGVLYLLGARGLILILLAFMLSAVASYILLASQRDVVGSRMGGFFGRMNERIEESKRSEDAFIEYEAAQVKEEQRKIADSAAEVEPPAETIPPPAGPNTSAGPNSSAGPTA